MKAKILNSLIRGLDHKLQHFSMSTMLIKMNNKDLTPEQIKKFKDDVFNLEEDLIMMDCQQ